MSISINISAAAEATLREAWGPDVGTAAFEALLIEGYRTGKLSLGDIAAILGLETRLQAESWLGARKVSLNYSVADLESDRETLNRVLGPVRHR